MLRSDFIFAGNCEAAIGEVGCSDAPVIEKLMMPMQHLKIWDDSDNESMENLETSIA